MQRFKISVPGFAEAVTDDLLCAASAAPVEQMCAFSAALLCGEDCCIFHKLHEKTPFGYFKWICFRISEKVNVHTDFSLEKMTIFAKYNSVSERGF